MEQELPQTGGLSWRTVLVVGLLLLICGAIGMPYLLEAREQARRTECKNRLKQVGIALLNYHETFATFPPGWVATGPQVDGKPEESAYSWGVACIPFLESGPLYESIHRNEPFQNEIQTPRELKLRGKNNEILRSAAPLGGRVFQVMRCPSDLGLEVDTTSTVPQAAMGNYVGNFGVGIPRYGRHYSGLFQGILAENSRIRIRDIRDGTFGTVVVGERRMVAAGHTWTEGELEGPLNSYWLGFPRGTSPLAIVGSITNGEYPLIGSCLEEIELHKQGELSIFGDLNGLGSKWPMKPRTLRFAGINKSLNGELLGNKDAPSVSISYSSHHLDGAHLLMADGSVRFVWNGISEETMAGLVRRFDGLHSNGDEFYGIWER